MRVGNAANQQVQLDVFGPIVNLISAIAHRRDARGADHASALTDRDWELVCSMVTAVERRWFEPDHGIWEIRDNPRHHVYSKVMAGSPSIALSHSRIRSRVPPVKDGNHSATRSRRKSSRRAGTTTSVPTPPHTTVPTSTRQPCSSD